ncbi:signal peptidase I [Jannaschia seohaensis]|uniref:Signal peptidase I n=1 Tax=Jannaschia seohaensis TaxID=475081 RepID=A0A2Y9BXT5_9RHOB|nr:signal peptidase I [Jannaschia seohaensis]PWJ20982.1 signal peptidase I [Jannaschia seohaensis]SSA41392.1 signal peptidase I [Jannaschia seohaensis]
MTARALRRSFVLSGTGGRRALFAWTVVYHVAALGILAWGPLDTLGPWGRLVCYGALGLASTAWVCAIVRRLHDMGRSGWFAPLFAIPVVGLAPLAWALTAAPRPLDPDRFRPKRRYRIASIVMLLCVALFASRAFWAPHRMVSVAMVPTITQGTPFVSYRFGPGRYGPGEIVLVTVTASDGRTRRLVARVVATAGQSVALQDGVPVLDGVPATHAPCPLAACTVETLPDGVSYRIRTDPSSRPMAAVTVPEGALFLLADNRIAARDSRIPPEEGGLGLVPVSAVEGRVLTFAKVTP